MATYEHRWYMHWDHLGMPPQGLSSYFACNKRMPEDLYNLCIDYLSLYIDIYTHTHTYTRLFAKCVMCMFILLQTCCNFKAIPALFFSCSYLFLKYNVPDKYYQSWPCVLLSCWEKVALKLQVHPISRSSCINASSTNAKKSVLSFLN